MTPLLNIKNLDAFYGQAQVLFGVSLQIFPGEVVALTGPNGAGKTTLLKAIMNMVERKAHVLNYQGQSLLSLKTFDIARCGIGYVPEDRRVFADLTVDENLQVGQKVGKGHLPVWTQERLFEIFPNLATLRHRRAGQMSGGEQQMLTLARTLMGNPELILLDEPSEGLAPLIVDMMEKAVLSLKALGVSVLLSEQNQGIVRRLNAKNYSLEKGIIKNYDLY